MTVAHALCELENIWTRINLNKNNKSSKNYLSKY